jgi:hypothetical protein
MLAQLLAYQWESRTPWAGESVEGMVPMDQSAAIIVTGNTLGL